MMVEVAGIVAVVASTGASDATHEPSEGRHTMTIQEQIKAYRAANPRSRVVNLFKFARNGSGTKQMACVLCGAVGPTWSGKYRKTVRAIVWEAEHQKTHDVQS
jgi:hypothetical protein